MGYSRDYCTVQYSTVHLDEQEWTTVRRVARAIHCVMCTSPSAFQFFLVRFRFTQCTGVPLLAVIATRGTAVLVLGVIRAGYEKSCTVGMNCKQPSILLVVQYRIAVRVRVLLCASYEYSTRTVLVQPCGPPLLMCLICAVRVRVQYRSLQHIVDDVRYEYEYSYLAAMNPASEYITTSTPAASHYSTVLVLVRVLLVCWLLVCL